MNGKELRRTMWKQVKGRRQFLLIALFITMVPNMLQTFFLSSTGITIPAIFGNPFLIVTNMLTLGLCKIAMEQVGDGEKKLGDMLFFLKDGLFGKALILSVVFWVVNTAFTVLPQLIQQYGVDMMAQTSTITTLADGTRSLQVSNQGLYAQGEIFNGLGMLLNLACGFISTVILFPIQYRFALHPQEPVMDQLAEGVSLGWKNFWGVFGYRFMVSLPIGILYMAYLGATIFLLEYALFVVLAFAAGFCYYQPYVVLAEAALAKRLFVMEEKGEKIQDTGRRLRN